MQFKNSAIQLNIEIHTMSGANKNIASQAEDLSIASIDEATKKYLINYRKDLIEDDMYQNDTDFQESLENITDTIITNEPVLIEQFVKNGEDIHIDTVFAIDYQENVVYYIEATV